MRALRLSPLLLLLSLCTCAVASAQEHGIPLRLDETLLASTFDPSLSAETELGEKGKRRPPPARAALVARARKKGPASRLMGRIIHGKRRDEVWIGDFDVASINSTRIRLDEKGAVILSLVMSDFTERWFELRFDRLKRKYEIARRHRGHFGGNRPLWTQDVL